MLSSRYLHLHEALGLGPMWLKQEAAVIPAEPAAPEARSTTVRPAVQASAPALEQERTLSAGTHHARMAAMATVHGEAEKTPPAAPNPTPAPPQPAEPPVRPAAETQPEPQPAAAPTVRLSDGLPRLSAPVKTARLMVVSICPSTEDALHGELFHGKAGELLDNMLAAIRLTPQQVHKTSWVKTAPVFTPQPDEAQIRTDLPILRQELEASQAQAVLFLGQVFEQKEMLAFIEELCGGTPRFTAPHPARLLHQPRLKAYAWEVLKKTAAAL